MSSPLYSQRAGRERAISSGDLASLVWRHLARLRDSQGLLAEWLLGYHDPDTLQPHAARISDPEAFFLERLKVSGIAYWVMESDAPSARVQGNLDLLLDLIELLYRECVSFPAGAIVESDEYGNETAYFTGPFVQGQGQSVFRAAINSALALNTPPLELIVGGDIRELPPDAFAPLVDAEVPASEEAEIRDPIEGATHQFFRRGVSTHDRLAAVKRLADVLERLRGEIRTEALSADERALFDIANNFAIRHNDRGQKIDYNRDLWLEWTFYVYLATARTMIRLREDQSHAIPAS